MTGEAAETPGARRGPRSVGGLLVRDTSLLLAVRLYGAAVNFVVFVWLARVARPETTGRWAALLAVWSVLGVLIDFGGEQQATRAIAREPARTRGLLRALLRMKVALSIVGVVALAVVAWWIEPSGEGRAAYAWSAFTIFGIVGGAFAVVLRTRHRVGRLAFAVAAGQTVFLLVAVRVLCAPRADGARFEGLAIGYAAGALVGGGLVWLAARRVLAGECPSPPRAARVGRAGEAGLRTFLAEAWPQGVAALAAILYFQLDTLMLKAIAGDAAAGFYNAAYRLLGLFVAVSGTAAAALLPIASRALDRPARFRSVFGGSLSLLLLASVSLATLVVAVAPDLFRWLYATRMADFHVSIPTLRILFAAGVCAAIGAAGSIRLLALGRAGRWMWIVVGGVGFNVLANLWAIPRFGHVGAAWTTLATEAGVAIAALSDLRDGIAADGRPLPWRRAVRWTVRLASVAVASFAVAWSFRDTWLLGAGAGAAVFWLGVAALGLVPRRLFDPTAPNGKG